MRLHIYNRNEGAGPWWTTAQWCLRVGEHATTVLKGWWRLGSSSINRHFEIEIALGGEDNMLQFGVVLPFVLRWHIGVRVPRKLTSAWIYERREWTVRVGYVGRWLDLMFASDEDMRDMGSYYRRKRANPDCANCGHNKGFHENDEHRCITLSEVNHGCAPCACPGYAPAKLVWTRAALWPGWHLEVRPRLIDRVFGRRECITTKGEPEPVVVPMPEGNYPGMMRREDRVWKRKRWPWANAKRSSYWIDMEVGVPTPGKGENSWDCEDDAIFGTGGATPAEAVANVTKAALRQRERYGAGRGWTPDAGWPAGIAR